MKIRPATLEDIHYLKTRIRQADRKESELATGRKVEWVLPQAFELSTVCNVLLAEGDDRPVAVYGVAPTPGNPGLGTVWMLATPRLPEISLSLLKEAKQLSEGLLLIYPEGLHNMALWSKTTARWLNKVGYAVYLQPIIRNGAPFMYFFMPGSGKPTTIGATLAQQEATVSV